MKTKICALCQKEETTLFRVQIEKGKTWVFVCTDCCKKVKNEPNMVALGKAIVIRIN